VQTLFYTLLGIGFGLSLIIYTKPIRDQVGTIDFAEKYFGMGGTYNFLKLLGLFIIIFTIFWATGTIDRLIPDFLLNKGMQ
jgi:hypothetical protein